MTAIQNFFQNLLYQIPKIGISDIIDILVVSFLIYTVLRLVRPARCAGRSFLLCQHGRSGASRRAVRAQQEEADLCAAL